MNTLTTWVHRAPCAANPIDDRFTRSPLDQPIDDVLDALTECRRCVFTNNCLDAVQPAQSWFDGVAGGALWINGRRADLDKVRLPDPVGSRMLGALAHEYSLAELDAAIGVPIKTLRRWIQEPHLSLDLSWLQRARVRLAYRTLTLPVAPRGRLARARRDVAETARRAGHQPRQWWKQAGRNIYTGRWTA